MFILRVPHVTSSDAREGVSGVLALSICRFLRGWLITKRTYLSDLRRARSHDFPWLRGFVETDLNEGKSVWLRREETNEKERDRGRPACPASGIFASMLHRASRGTESCHAWCCALSTLHVYNNATLLEKSAQVIASVGTRKLVKLSA